MQSSPETDPAAIPFSAGMRKRLFTPKAGWMLARNTVVASSVFVLGLGLLWVLVTKLHWNEYLAVAVSFLVTTTSHYLVGRLWVFTGSERKLSTGYALFLGNAAFGLAGTMVLYAMFTEIFALNFLVARIVASIFVGLAIFSANALFNFKVL